MSSQNSHQKQKSDDGTHKGPETDPEVVGRPSSIFGIFLIFAVVILAASWGGAQSSSVIINIRKFWAMLMEMVGR